MPMPIAIAAVDPASGEGATGTLDRLRGDAERVEGVLEPRPGAGGIRMLEPLSGVEEPVLAAFDGPAPFDAWSFAPVAPSLPPSF